MVGVSSKGIAVARSRLRRALDLVFAGAQALDPRITFSRTTNATLTNSAGLVANAPHNLLTYSEQFDNGAWTKGQVTVTANSIAAPNGTTTADTAAANATVAEAYLRFTTTQATSTAYTISVYAKAGTVNFVRLRNLAVSGSPNAWFNLSTGTTATVSAGLTATITAANNGWYRCTITGTTLGAIVNNLVDIASCTADGSTAVVNGDSVYLWGAQLEIGTTATAYNPTTVKNLLGFTEHFDNAAWDKINASITSGFTDIYGQPFAQKLVENTANSRHEIQTSNAVTSTAGTSYTFTVYLKAADRRYVSVIRSGPAANGAGFDLVDGTITSIGASVTASITSVGNGWYRCSITSSIADTFFNPYVCLRTTPGNAVETYTGDGTSGLYIFGAQLSDSASVDPYVYNPVAAPSSVAYYGPRFDYDPVTLAPKGLLIEEQRTNLSKYSQDFSNAAWTLSNVIVGSSTTSPDGTTNGQSIMETDVTSAHRVLTTSNVTVVNGTTYTFSVYCKANGRNYIRLSDGNVANVTCFFNLSDGTVGTKGSAVTGSAIKDMGNDWYLCSMTYVMVGTIALPIILISTDGSTLSYAGDVTKGIYAWGAQLEAGAFATSYIPTVASQVTRAADSASMIGNNFARWYNQTEGTLFGEASGLSTSGIRILGIGPGPSNLMYLTLVQNAVVASGTTQASFSFTPTANIAYKTAMAYKTNDFASSYSGSIATDVSGAVPVGLTAATIGWVDSAGAFTGSGHIKRIAYYNRRLSNTELQAITS